MSSRFKKDLVNGPECEYVSTAQGSGILVHEGFMYGSNNIRESKDSVSRTYWRCCKTKAPKGSNQNESCKASAVTTNNRIVKISPAQKHNHPPDYAKIEARRVFDRMKLRAATEETPLDQIYHDTVDQTTLAEEVAAKLPRAMATAKRLKRVREKISAGQAGPAGDVDWLATAAGQLIGDDDAQHVNEMNFLPPAPTDVSPVQSANPSRFCHPSSSSNRLTFSTSRLSTSKVSSVRSNFIVVNTMSWRKIGSLVAATMTPMHSDGSVNVELIPRYIEHLLNTGIRYIFVNGTAGESISLSVSERKLLAEKWLAAAKGKLSGVIVHVGGNNLCETQELATHAENYGCLAVAAMAPTFFKPKSVGCLVNYCSDVAKLASKTPFIYCHCPAMTGVDLNMTEFLSDAVNHIPTLVGVKFSSTDLADATQAQQLFDRRFEVFYGVETMMLGALSMGINSYIGGSLSILGQPCKRLIDAFNHGDWEQCRSDQYQIQQFFRCTHKLGDVQAMIAAFKSILSCSGLDLGPPRSPIKSLSREELVNIEKSLEAMRYDQWIR